MALGDPTRQAIFECLADRPRGCRRTRGSPARESAGGLPAPAGTQRCGARGRSCRGHAPHLSAQPRRGRRHAGPTRHVLAPGPRTATRPPSTERHRSSHHVRDTAATVQKEDPRRAPLERAFKVFTERFGDFKPPEHNLLTVPIVATVFEPRVGGHIIDRGADGSECRWARILTYEPPDRVVFSWDIGPSWQIETNPATHQRGRGSLYLRGAKSHPRASWSTETSTGTDPAGPRWHEGVDSDAGMAALPRPLRSPRHPGALALIPALRNPTM